MSECQWTRRAGHSFAIVGVVEMLEVRNAGDRFMLYDTEADEPVMLFATRREAEQLIASMQVEEIHAQLRCWSPDTVPVAY